MTTSQHEENELNEISQQIIGCAFRVSNILGHGFLEKVYENALLIELRKNGLSVEPQKKLQVIYEGIIIGDYTADLVVNSKVLVELKAIKEFDDAHYAQCLNYLKISKIKLGLLLNFGTPKVEIKRIVNGL